MIPHIVGKLAPKSSHLTRELVKYVLGRGYFRAVPTQNGEKNVTSPPPPQSLNGSEAHVWAAVGATFWVDCLQKNSTPSGRSLAKTKYGNRSHSVGVVVRIRWTGLDECCNERGHVASGGREGSGSTRERLAARGPPPAAPGQG